MKDEILTRKQALAKKIRELLIDKRMTQSDLARLVFNNETFIDKRGYSQVKGKDRISAWCGAQSLPEPHHLKALADALGVEIEYLDPSYTTEHLAKIPPAFEMKYAENRTNHCVLRVNQVVSFDKAIRIAAILNEPA